MKKKRYFKASRNELRLNPNVRDFVAAVYPQTTRVHKYKVLETDDKDIHVSFLE